MDDLLLAQAQRGDRQALEELCQREWRPVYAILYGAARNRAEAQDLTQEVFLRALRAFDRFQAGGVPFSAYLATIARNLLRDRWRRAAPNLVPLHDLPETVMADRELAGNPAASAERERLRQALATLSPDYQAVVRLRLLEGYSGAETAAILGRSPAAVRQLQHRALLALQTAPYEETHS